MKLDNNFLSEYLIAGMTWPNKYTTPVVDINTFMISGESVSVNYSVGFKKVDDSKVYPYFRQLNCTLQVPSLKEFLRTRNLNIIVHD